MQTGLSRRGFLRGCGVAAGGALLACVGAELAAPLIFKEKLIFDENLGAGAAAQESASDGGY
jgi:hypothetical protein